MSKFTQLIKRWTKSSIKEKIHNPEITIDYKGQMERQADAFGSLFTAAGV